MMYQPPEYLITPVYNLNGDHRTVKERFESRYIPVPESGCWIWESGTDSDGYGTIWVNGRNERATRISWLLYKGDAPKGILLCHKCDVPSCVNPEHLFLGTPADNSHDAVKKGRNLREDKHPKAKLTKEQVLEIRNSQLPYQELAKIYGLLPASINNIQKRRTWKNI